MKLRIIHAFLLLGLGAAITQSVHAATATTLTLTSSCNPCAVDTSLVLTATITPSNATGTFTFFDGATNIGTAAAGLTAFITSFHTPGNHSLTAQYAGNATFSPSTSPVMIQVVISPVTTLTLASSLNPTNVVPPGAQPSAQAGQVTLLTATLSPPTNGTVTFFDGATQIGSVSFLTMGQGSVSASFSTAGNHPLTAKFAGNDLFSPSTSNTVTQAVNGPSLTPTTLTLSSSLNPTNVVPPGAQPSALAGNVTILTATISPSTTGTVTFFDGATQIGSSSLFLGQASISPSFTTTGNHLLTAKFAANDTFAASTSNTVTQAVNGPSLTPTTLTLSSSLNPTNVVPAGSQPSALAGQVTILTATISPSTTGSITFFDGATQIATVSLFAGQATASASFTTSGNHALTAKFAGSDTFAASTSNTVTQAVNGPSLTATALTLRSSKNPCKVGESFGLTAAITPNNVTGMITFFMDGATQLGTANLVNGSAALNNIPCTIPGNWSLTAKFPGDNTFSASTSSVLTQEIDAAGTSTTTSLSASPTASAFGQLVTLTATVSPANATGQMQFLDGQNSLGSANLSGGTATLTTNSLTLGSHSLTAAYAGSQPNFTGSTSAAVNFTVSRPGGGGGNLVPGSLVTQSTTLPGVASAAAPSAADGNTDGIFGDGSVSTTNLENNPWWQVDLGASTAIGSVAIWNRTDCCGSRLSDYWVFISDTPFAASDTPATLQFRPGTWNSHQTNAPNPSTTISAITQGRYLRVQLSNPGYLSLAEVQIFGPVSQGPSDLAQGQTATQSSTLPGTPNASAAVDGNTDGLFGDGSVTATNPDFNAWWQVDLGSSKAIASIVVWNRTDCCGSRLGDYWVFVSDTPFLSTDTPAMLQFRAGTFSSHQTFAPNPSTTISASTQGRYVRVQLNGADFLSLAEVQVFGPSSGPPSSNLSLGKAATQSSALPGTPSAGAAIDGNTDGNFGDGSVIATNLDFAPWWQVDLGASATVGSITIWNRTDCCGSRLNDYWVFVSDTPFQSTDTPSTLQSRAATFASHQTSAPSPSATIQVVARGRYVRVQLTGTNYLSLAEVQIFGTSSTPSSTNLSLRSPATQSSTLSGTPSASVVVDGNTDGLFADGSVAATNLELTPWWQVDLQSSANVSSVVVWNRTDCCGSRLNDYWVFVSNTPFLASDTPSSLQGRPGIFASHQTAAPSPSTIVPVVAPGRYVRVQLNGMNYLSLAEVQVFGGNQ